MGLLSTPMNMLVRVFEEIADKAEQELYNEDALKVQLVELHRRLEAGALTEAEFDAREVEILEQLQVCARRKRGGGRASRTA